VARILRRRATLPPRRHGGLPRRRALPRLIAQFPDFDPKYATNERGEPGRKAVVTAVSRIGPAYARFDQLMRDRAFLDRFGQIAGIPGLLYDPDYLGGDTHENLDGQELDTHVDFNFHPTRGWHRRLNLILFLNDDWDPAWGGNLELLRDPWDAEPIMVPPRANRAVLFETTGRSWHGFRRILLPADTHTSRRTLAVYFYTKDRPAEETAPNHGTTYYQRPLPAHLQPGHTLTQDDLWELERLLTRRDTQIRFLYKREQEVSHVMQGITRSPSFRIGRALTWPGRALRRWMSRPK
jgi:hypothetical protein